MIAMWYFIIAGVVAVLFFVQFVFINHNTPGCGFFFSCAPGSVSLFTVIVSGLSGLFWPITGPLFLFR
jgi:hypothetical protein